MRKVLFTLFKSLTSVLTFDDGMFEAGIFPAGHTTTFNDLDVINVVISASTISIPNSYKSISNVFSCVFNA